MNEEKKELDIDEAASEEVVTTSLFHNRIFWKIQLFLVACSLPQFYAIYAYIPRNEFTAFLHYNIYFGIDQSGEWYQLFLLPASLCIILIINTVISLKSTVAVLHWFALCASISAVIGISAALMLIIQLNI